MVDRDAGIRIGKASWRDTGGRKKDGTDSSRGGQRGGHTGNDTGGHRHGHKNFRQSTGASRHLALVPRAKDFIRLNRLNLKTTAPKISAPAKSKGTGAQHHMCAKPDQNGGTCPLAGGGSPVEGDKVPAGTKRRGTKVPPETVGWERPRPGQPVPKGVRRGVSGRTRGMEGGTGRGSEGYRMGEK